MFTKSVAAVCLLIGAGFAAFGVRLLQRADRKHGTRSLERTASPLIEELDTSGEPLIVEFDFTPYDVPADQLN